MPCHLPITAWKGPEPKQLVIRNLEVPTWDRVQLPCGKCFGCIKNKAREWAFRCHYELTQHETATFATLTYDEANKPPTLQKRHLQLFLKRLRKQYPTLPSSVGTDGNIRFFASGEYGTITNRPHYHAILFGIASVDQKAVEKIWGHGHARCDPIHHGAISYVAGYTSKKTRDAIEKTHERIDLTTGELYHYQPPFIQMSRRPGIGGHLRQWPKSWAEYAVMDGHKIPVPRYLKESWKQQATPEEIHENLIKTKTAAEQRQRTPEQIVANAMLQAAKQEQQNSTRRKYA